MSTHAGFSSLHPHVHKPGNSGSYTNGYTYRGVNSNISSNYIHNGDSLLGLASFSNGGTIRNGGIGYARERSSTGSSHSSGESQGSFSDVGTSQNLINSHHHYSMDLGQRSGMRPLREAPRPPPYIATSSSGAESNSSISGYRSGGNYTHLLQHSALASSSSVHNGCLPHSNNIAQLPQHYHNTGDSSLSSDQLSLPQGLPPPVPQRPASHFSSLSLNHKPPSLPKKPTNAYHITDL